MDSSDMFDMFDGEGEEAPTIDTFALQAENARANLGIASSKVDESPDPNTRHHGAVGVTIGVSEGMEAHQCVGKLWAAAMRACREPMVTAPAPAKEKKARAQTKDSDTSDSDSEEDSDDWFDYGCSGSLTVMKGYVQDRIRWGMASLSRSGSNAVTQWPIVVYNRLTDVVESSSKHPFEHVLKTCLNCGGIGHISSSCPMPFDHVKVAESQRKQKELRAEGGYGRRVFTALGIPGGSSRPGFQFGLTPKAFKPGKLSSSLRQALGMKENDPPPFLGAMSRAGYPPGWTTRKLPGEEQGDNSEKLQWLLGDDVEMKNNHESSSSADKNDIRRRVDFPGLFGVAIPAGADQSAWTMAANTYSAESFYALKARLVDGPNRIGHPHQQQPTPRDRHEYQRLQQQYFLREQASHPQLHGSGNYHHSTVPIPHPNVQPELHRRVHGSLPSNPMAPNSSRSSHQGGFQGREQAHDSGRSWQGGHHDQASYYYQNQGMGRSDYDASHSRHADGSGYWQGDGHRDGRISDSGRANSHIHHSHNYGHAGQKRDWNGRSGDLDEWERRDQRYSWDGEHGRDRQRQRQGGWGQ